MRGRTRRRRQLVPPILRRYREILAVNSHFEVADYGIGDNVSILADCGDSFLLIEYATVRLDI